MTPTEQHDDLVRRLNNAGERVYNLFFSLRESVVVWILGFLVWGICLFELRPFTNAEPTGFDTCFSIVSVLVFYLTHRLCICLDPCYREICRTENEKASICEQIRKFESTHTMIVTWKKNGHVDSHKGALQGGNDPASDPSGVQTGMA